MKKTLMALAAVCCAAVSQSIASEAKIAKIVQTDASYATVQAAINAAEPGQTVQMLADSTESINLGNGTSVTLDLAGRMLKGPDEVRVIEIQSGATLSITDSCETVASTERKWTTTDISFEFVSCNDALWVLTPDATGTPGVDYLTTTGGVITGGSTSSGGGAGIWVHGGTLNFHGGTVVGNKDTATMSFSCSGGGLLAESGTVSIDGGRFCGNYGYRGGAISINTKDAAFSMTGALVDGNVGGAGGAFYTFGDDLSYGEHPALVSNVVIRANCGTDFGGAVAWSEASSWLRLMDVTVSGNGRADDLKILLNAPGRLEVLNSRIVGNFCSRAAYYYNDGDDSLPGELIVGGTTVVTNNLNGSQEANFFLSAGKTISVSTEVPLAAGACIGVTTQTEPVAYEPVVIVADGSEGDEAYFASDNALYDVLFEDGRLILSVRDVTFTPTVPEHATLVAVCTNGAPMEAVGGTYTIPTNATATVIYAAQEGYFFDQDATAVTNELVTSTNPVTEPEQDAPVVAGAGSEEKGPFGDSPIAIPGTLEAEDYDLGGESVSYHDTTEGNDCGEYRENDVDIGYGFDYTTWESFYYVTQTEASEWLEYAVDVEEAGEYLVTARVSTSEDGAAFALAVKDGEDLATFTVPNTEGSFWELEETATLAAGKQLFRIRMTAGEPAIDRLTFVRILPTEPIVAAPPEIDHTTRIVLTNGVESTETEISGQWAAWSNRTAVVVYQADDGYLFANGTTESTNELDTAVNPAGLLDEPPAAPVEAVTGVRYLAPVYNTPGDAASGLNYMETNTCSAALAMTASSATWGTEDSTVWYVATKGEYVIDGSVTCLGHVHLILAPGAKLTVTATEEGAPAILSASDRSSLTVYGTPDGAGTLVATAGAWGSVFASRSLTLNGGTFYLSNNGENGVISGEDTVVNCGANVLFNLTGTAPAELADFNGLAVMTPETPVACELVTGFKVWTAGTSFFVTNATSGAAVTATIDTTFAFAGTFCTIGCVKGGLTLSTRGPVCEILQQPSSLSDFVIRAWTDGDRGIVNYAWCEVKETVSDLSTLVGQSAEVVGSYEEKAEQIFSEDEEWGESVVRLGFNSDVLTEGGEFRFKSSAAQLLCGYGDDVFPDEDGVFHVAAVDEWDGSWFKVFSYDGSFTVDDLSYVAQTEGACKCEGADMTRFPTDENAVGNHYLCRVTYAHGDDSFTTDSDVFLYAPTPTETIVTENLGGGHMSATVYTNGVESAETEEGVWQVWSNRTAVVVYQADPGYNFQDGSTVVTNALDTTKNPAAVVGNLPVCDIVQVTKDDKVTYYGSLEAAFAAIGDYGTGEVKLLANVDLGLDGGVSLPEGADLTLELNGWTITQTTDNDYSPIYLPGTGRLTINDTPGCGGITSLRQATETWSSSRIVYCDGDADLTVNGGTFATTNAAGEACLFHKNGSGTWTFNGGTYIAVSEVESGHAVAIFCESAHGQTLISGGTYVVEGRASDGYGICAVSDSTETVEITGGDFTIETESNGWRPGVLCQNGVFVIKGGSFNVSSAMSGSSCVAAEGSGTVIISNGTFAAENTAEYGYGARAINGGQLILAGGTFNAVSAGGTTASVEGEGSGSRVTLVDAPVINGSKGGWNLAIQIQNGCEFDMTGYTGDAMTCLGVINGEPAYVKGDILGKFSLYRSLHQGYYAVRPYDDDVQGGSLVLVNLDEATSNEYPWVIGPAVAELVPESGNYFTTLQSAIDAAGEGQTVRLISDATENVTVSKDKDIVLDLNGHVLASELEGTCVLGNLGTLVITDSRYGDQTCAHYLAKEGDGWCVTDEETDVVVYGGCITGGRADDQQNGGGGISNDGTLTLESGIICGNCKDGGGGGVRNGGTFTMTGGEICYNYGSASAGGISEDGLSTTVSGGKIHHNKAGASWGTGQGGGIAVWSDSQLNVTGGEISENWAGANGGGIAVYMNATFNLTGGTITYNTSYIGGGVGNLGTSTLGGKVIVRDNVAEAFCPNLGIVSNIGGAFTQNSDTPLDDGADIGVSLVQANSLTEFTPIAGTFLQSAMDLDAEYFTSDDSTYAIKFVNDHLELFEGTLIAPSMTIGVTFTIYTNGVPIQASRVSVDKGTPAYVVYETAERYYFEDGKTVVTNTCDTSVNPATMDGPCVPAYVTVGAYKELVEASESAVPRILFTEDITMHSTLTLASDRTVTIEGNGHILTVPVPGANEIGVLNDNASDFTLVDNDGNLTVTDLTLRGGSATCICNENSGALKMTGCTIERSGSVQASGGGLCNQGNCYLKDCRISRNNGGCGGGFLSNGGILVLDCCSLSENRSLLNDECGGGGGQNDALLVVNNSTFANNTSSAIGGAINNHHGRSYVFNTTFVGNISDHDGFGTKCGGAFGLSGGAFYAANLLLVNNYAKIAGGSSSAISDFRDCDVGIFNGEGTCTSSGCGYGTVRTGDGDEDVLELANSKHVATNDVFATYRQSGVLNVDGTSGEALFNRPIITRCAIGTYIAPLAEKSAATTDGTSTYVSIPEDVSTFSAVTIKLGVGTDDEIASVGEFALADAADKVTTYQDGSTRAAGVIGAAGPTASVFATLTVKATDYGTVTGDGSPSGDTYEAGTAVAVEAVPNNGCEFIGWCVNGEETPSVTDNPYKFELQEDTVLEPVFDGSGATATVTFSAGAGEGDPPAAITDRQIGESITFPEPGEISRTGYAFGGWLWEDGIVYAAGETSSPIVSADVSVVAVWTLLITQQPAAANDYIVGVDTTDEISYQWYEGPTKVKLSEWYKWGVNSAAFDETENVITKTDAKSPIEINMAYCTVGAVLTFTSTDGSLEGAQGTVLTVSGPVDGVYTYSYVCETEDISVHVAGGEVGTTLENVMIDDYAPVEGQTTATLTEGKDGVTYFCRLTYDGGLAVQTDFVTYGGGSAGTATVTFSVGAGGENPPEAMTDLNVGESFTFPDAGEMSRTGYEFDGWMWEDGSVYGAGETSPELESEEVKVTAVWSLTISQQPSSANGYTVGVDTKDEIAYQWYGEIEKKLSEVKHGVNEASYDENANVITKTEDGSLIEICIAACEECVLTFTSTVGSLKGDEGIELSVSEPEDGVYTYTYEIESEDADLRIVGVENGTTLENLTVSGIMPIEGQTTATLTEGTVGTMYACLLTYDDGQEIETDFVTYGAAASAVAVIVETGVEYATVQGAIKAASDCLTVQMIADAVENVTISEGWNLTLDLNGCVLKAKDSTDHVLVNEGTLVIIDSRYGDAKCPHYLVQDGNIWDVVDSETEDVVYGGCITGGHVMDGKDGGGICNDGDLTFKAGIVCGNSIGDEGESNDGGGVRNGGTFLMMGGEICYNYASENGGGLIQNGGLATISGGKIHHNQAGATWGSGQGGGISVGEGDQLDVRDGDIYANWAGANGGGIAVYSKAVFNFVGGTVTNNTAYIAGGVGNIGTGSLGGTVVVKDNTAIGLAPNLTVVSNMGGAFTKIAKEPFVDGAEIGVSLLEAKSMSEFVSVEGAFLLEADAADAAYFTSDNAAYAVACSGTSLILSAQSVSDVSFVPEEVPHATATVYVGGKQVEMSEDEYLIPFGAKASVVYTADDGYYFSDGTAEWECDIDTSSDPAVAKAPDEPNPGVCELNGVIYASLALAFDEVQTDETIYMLADFEETSSLTVDEKSPNFTLNANGHALTASFDLASGRALTVENLGTDSLLTVTTADKPEEGAPVLVTKNQADPTFFRSANSSCWATTDEKGRVVLATVSNPIVTSIGGEDVIIEIPQTWRDEYKPTGEEIMRPEQKQENGLPAWQNYVLGFDPTNKLSGIYADAPQNANTDTVTIETKEIAASQIAPGFGVQYRLERDEDGFAPKTQETASFELDITGDDPTGHYRISVVITSNDVALAQTAEALNVVGMVKQSQSAANAIISVPWGKLAPGEDQEIAVSNLVKTATLDEGDELRVYRPGTDRYEIWKLNAKKEWEPGTTVKIAANGGADIVTADPPESATIPRGSGVWLCRKDPSKPYYLYGQSNGEENEVELTKGANLVGATGIGDYDLNAHVKGAVEGDQIQVRDTEGTPKVYTYKDGAWGYYQTVKGKTVNIGGIDYTTSKTEWTTTNSVIKAGTGFWLHNQSGKIEVK